MKGHDVFISHSIFVGLHDEIDTLKRQRRKMQKAARFFGAALKKDGEVFGGYYVIKKAGTYDYREDFLSSCHKCYRVESLGCCRGEE